MKTHKNDLQKETGKETESKEKNQEKEQEKKGKHDVDYKDKYLRALADYQNLLKRVEKDKQDFVHYANARLIEKLLDVLDDFERAQGAVQNEGVALIYKKLQVLLESEGVKKIEIGENDEFNPERMECIEAEKDGTKLEIIQNGYVLNGKVIRAARVKVVR